MPFIVAVRGSARKLGLTKGNLSYSTYRQRPTDESDPRGQRRGEILGFAFLSVWEPGLGSGIGSGLGTSRATAKINVYVHPDYRKKKVGFSLLDMLLTTVSDRYSSQSGYDFVDPDNSPVYKGPGSHERQYYRLYFHYLVKHKQLAEGNKKLEQEQKTYDDDLVWIRKMLDEQLGFTELVRFEAVHRSAKCRDGPVYWLDQVVFEHACHFAPGLVKDDY
jgi:GNAT superfamily N-acetyltransferase